MFISNEVQVLKELSDAIGRRLITAAIELETEHMKRIGVFNPPPYLDSAPKGEYPRKRTGFLQGHILHDPTTPAAVMEAGRIRIGYARSASYGAWLELKGWKGIWDTALDIQTRLREIVGSGFAAVSHFGDGVRF